MTKSVGKIAGLKGKISDIAVLPAGNRQPCDAKRDGGTARLPPISRRHLIDSAHRRSRTNLFHAHPLRPCSERRLLQSTSGRPGARTILAGAAGIVRGLGRVRPATSRRPSMATATSATSRACCSRSALAYWSTVPRIEVQGDRFRLLTGLVLIGGLAPAVCRRAARRAWHRHAGGALIMELVVTPGLALWRERVDVRESGLTPPSIAASCRAGDRALMPAESAGSGLGVASLPWSGATKA